jgi:hypothetical protein
MDFYCDALMYFHSGVGNLGLIANVLAVIELALDRLGE